MAMMATQKVLTQTEIDAQMKYQTEMPIITMCYIELLGQEFTGYLNGAQIIPADDDLVIRSKLAAIQNVAQGKVWKGFTNHLDSKYGKDWDYRFFVNLDRAGFLTPTKFRINNYETFTFPPKITIPPAITDYEFGVGFSLKVTAISGAPPPHPPF